MIFYTTLNRVSWGFIKMKVTLYQNCILTNAYSEVFDNKRPNPRSATGRTPLQDYLDGLPHFNIVVNESYMPMSGNVTFENDLIIQHIRILNTPCNYMEVTDTDTGVHFYAFIDDFQVVNNLVMVEYSVDVWSTFSPLMILRKSHLTNSFTRFIGNNKYITYFSSPAAINTSDKYILKECMQNYNTIDVSIIAEFSAYEPTTPDKISSRYSFIAEVKSTNRSEKWDLTNYEEVIKQLIQGIPYNKVGTASIFNLNFEINRIWVIPHKFEFQNTYGKGASSVYRTNANYIYQKIGDSTLIRNAFVFYDLSANFIRIKNSQGLNYKMYNKRVLNQNTYLTLAGFYIGNGSRRIAVGGNSLDINICLDCAIGINSFMLTLELGNGNIYDITADYEYKPPIASISAEAFEANKINYELTKQSQLFSTISDVIGILGTTVGGGAQIFKGGGKVSTGNVIGGASNIAQGTSTILTGLPNGIMNTIQGIDALKALEAPTNVYTQTLQANSATNLNIYLGLVQYVPDIEDDNPDTCNVLNYDETYKQFGYLVDEFVDNTIFTFDTKEVNFYYDILKFDFVKLYGGFTQSVATVLKQILLNGFKFHLSHIVSD